MDTLAFAKFNLLTNKQADEILDFFTQFDIKDRETVAEILFVTVKRSAGTIEDLYEVFHKLAEEIQINDIVLTLDEVSKFFNVGIRAEKAGIMLSKLIKKMNEE